ncbi:MAG TPA: hypothetical protein VF277_01310 [Steroidobacteraceae bacterium]
MERLLKLLDEIDDIGVVFHVHLRSVVVTTVLLAVFLAVLGAVLVFGPPDLLAAP